MPLKRTMTALAFALTAALALTARAADPPITYAERLGFPKDAKVVIFHSDDAGMSHSTNQGTIEAYENGLVSSVSVMMPCPWVPEIVRYIKTKPDHDFGLHLTLTSEWRDYRWGPLAGKPAVPGLVDSEGSLWGGVGEVIRHASPDEVEQEIRAQIDRAQTMGFEFTHMDSHMGTLFSSPAFFARYMAVGIEKQIPILVAGGHLQHARRENPQAVMALRNFAIKIWNAGLPVIDDIHTASYGWKNPEEKVDLYIDFLKNMKPGVTEVIMHCAHGNDELKSITDSHPIRQGDWQAMLDPRLKDAVKEQGVIITTWRELKDRRAKFGQPFPEKGEN